VSNFYAEWQAAKSGFLSAGLKTKDVPPAFVGMIVGRGADFGPALKTFDAARTFTDRMKALPAVMRGRKEYQDAIKQALRESEHPKVSKALTELNRDIDVLWMKVEEAAQPPSPSGQMVPTYTLRSFDLAAGVKTEFLKLEPIPVDVVVEVDKVFKQLIDSGQVGFRAEVLGEAGKAELEKVRDAFRETIAKIDNTIKKDPSILAAKTKEANEVLKYYGKIVQTRVDEAVQARWRAYLSGKADLKSFETKSKVKIVLGTIGVAVAITSAALSFGVAWMSIMAACKGISDVGKALKTYSETIDKTYEKLLDDIVHVDKLNRQRDEAKKKGEGQKASKAKEAAKEVIAGVLPITKGMLKVASDIDARCTQFSGQISKLETEADNLSGRIEVITRNLSTLPDRLLTTEQINLSRRMNKQLTTMMDDLADLARKVRAASAFFEKVKKAVAALKSKDSWTAGLSETLTGMGAKGIALYSAANFIYQCANAGKALIPL